MIYRLMDVNAVCKQRCERVTLIDNKLEARGCGRGAISGDTQWQQTRVFLNKGGG